MTHKTQVTYYVSEERRMTIPSFRVVPLNHTGASLVPATVSRTFLRCVYRAELTLILTGPDLPRHWQGRLSFVWSCRAWSLPSWGLFIPRKLESKRAFSQDGDGPHCHLRGEQEAGAGAALCMVGRSEESPQTSEKAGRAERQIWPGVPAT